MASTLNAFELLQQAGGLPSGNKTKKKKTKKPSAAKEDDEAPVVQEQATSQDAEFAPEASAVPILEKSARTFKTGGDRIKLWKDWIRQGTDRSSKALKYKAADGSVISFKELLLRSRALEITVESCVTSPLTMEQTHNLQQLLSTFIPRVDAAALASSVSRLAELLAEDTQSFDTTGAAQRAVHNVIGTLKSRDEAVPAAKPVSLQERLTAIEREAGKQHGFLASVEKLVADPSKARTANQGSGISKQHVDSAKELVKLYGQKFDLLQPDSAAAAKSGSASGPSQATINALEDLKGVISNHLQDARTIENKDNVKGAAQSKEAQRAQAVAALRREEAVLAQQATDIASQVRALESQLAQLRGQAAEVEDKRVRLQQRQAAALEALSATTGRKMSGLSAQHYHEELAATQQLLALVDPSRAAAPSSQLAAAQEEHGNTAAAYMTSVRNLLQMSSSSLADVPGKVVFCRQRISQAEKLSSLGGLGKEKSAKTLAESEKLLADTMKHCEDMVAGASLALEGMRSRFPAFSAEQQAELSQLAYEIEDMMSHIKGQYELAMGAVKGNAPATPAGQYNAAAQGAPIAGPIPGGVPVAAPVAGAFVPAPGGPTGVRPVSGLGPIMPPSAAPGPVATSNGSHAPKPAPAAAAAPLPASAATAVAAALAPPKAAADGFQQVGGKKSRRKA